MKELVVISGKGGTGKTSILASFAVLADDAVLADCDVDAADLHLVLTPTVRRRERFSGGSRARIMPGHCMACGKCEEICRFDAIFFDGPGNGRVERTFRVDPFACEGCGLCARFCTYGAVEFAPVVNGKWFVSETRAGPMVHARLDPGEENSGKLVSLVRTEARQLAERRRAPRVLIDGAPGIGCAVIASINNADLVLIVTEPTLSGRHDLERVAELTAHFGIPTSLAVNKWDLNADLARQIETEAAARGLHLAGRVRYDRAVTEAQLRRRTIIEHTENNAAADVRELWAAVSARLEQTAARNHEEPPRR